MTGDIESNINFIIAQQAQFAADMQAMKDRHTEGQKETEEIKGMLRQLAEVTMSLGNHAVQTDQRFLDTDGRLRETDRLIRELRESQAHSDQKLNALIDAVDKMIRRDGSPPPIPF